MAELIHEYAETLHAADGRRYLVRAYGEPYAHLWHGWLELAPLDGGAVLRTDRETTQPNREALVYWASGLEPIYWEGALERARRRRTADFLAARVSAR